MNKLTIAISLIILLFILIVAGWNSSTITNILHPNTTSLPSSVYGLNLKIPNSVYQDSEGLNSTEKINAITLALNNTIIKEGIQSNVNRSTTIGIGNITSGSAGKERGVDSGYLNTNLKIAYLPLGFIGGAYPMLSDNYVLYTDVTNNKTLGYVVYQEKGSPLANITIPPGAIWYTQVHGSTGAASGKTEPTMVPYYIINKDDVNSTSMMILSNDNFTKFKEGLSYTPLKYTDFWTNETIIADGNQPQKASILNGTAICGANVSFGNSIPLDANEIFPNLYYYVLIENKNKDKEVNIEYMNG